MDWQLLAQYLSYLVAIVSAFFSYLSNKNANRTTKEIEILKEDFARENEKRKNKQQFKNKNQTLILDFLSSINSYTASHSLENKRIALSSCAKVMPYLNDDQVLIVNEIMESIQQASTSGWNDATTEHADKVVFSANQKFLKTLNTMFQED
ncbi:hypothetical protein [uncultured Lactobacillus sp.]|uniref:hypothetical protein n=1 Tax=uncultured Lactobacillus sp. TaxID=153152 RepID=UPI0025F29A4E|nr:hypothetical protein [uncultured Lactobacillus sp.]